MANLTPQGQTTMLQLKCEFEDLAKRLGNREGWRSIEAAYLRGAADARKVAALDAEKFLASLDPLGERVPLHVD